MKPITEFNVNNKLTLDTPMMNIQFQPINHRNSKNKLVRVHNSVDIGKNKIPITSSGSYDVENESKNELIDINEKMNSDIINL